MIDIDLLQQDLTAQVALVNSKEISVQALNQQQLLLIKSLNPIVNAFISVNNSLIENTPADSIITNSVFSGVSVAVKDNIDVAGFNTTAGLEIRRRVAPQNDAFVIQQLRQSGACFSGKLNMHEGALGATNQNAHFGNCFNPHQLNLSPGGSSGGSGAAVSSCMTPLALGTDTMGSVRIPASYCGVFGLKPSRGVISNSGSVVCSRMMDSIGPLARSARDLTLALSVMTGFDIEDPNSLQLFFNNKLPSKPVLLIPDNLESLGIDADIIKDFESNIQAFVSLGCEIKTFDISNYDFGAARRAGLIICEAEMRVEHSEAWQHDKDNFSAYLTSLLSYIDKKSPMDVIKSERVLDNAIIQARKILSKGHYILMPTTPQRAISFNDAVPANQADLTSLANQAGLAAVSIPMITDHVLPAGMQLVGPHGSDFQLLSLADKWQKHTEFTYEIPQAIRNLLKVND